MQQLEEGDTVIELIDGVPYIYPYEPPVTTLTRQLDEFVRHVRTPAGVAMYHEPIGSPIIAHPDVHPDLGGVSHKELLRKRAEARKLYSPGDPRRKEAERNVLRSRKAMKKEAGGGEGEAPKRDARVPLPMSNAMAHDVAEKRLHHISWSKIASEYGTRPATVRAVYNRHVGKLIAEDNDSPARQEWERGLITRDEYASALTRGAEETPEEAKKRAAAVKAQNQEAYRKLAVKYINEVKPDLSKAEYHSLGQYRIRKDEINRLLIELPHAKPTPEQQEIIEGLDSALTHFTLPKDTVAYVRIPDTFEHNGKFHLRFNNLQFHQLANYGYMEASLPGSDSVAGEGQLVKLRLPKGIPVVMLDQTIYSSDQRILLPRGTKMRFNFDNTDEKTGKRTVDATVYDYTQVGDGTPGMSRSRDPHKPTFRSISYTYNVPHATRVEWERALDSAAGHQYDIVPEVVKGTNVEVHTGRVGGRSLGLYGGQGDIRNFRGHLTLSGEVFGAKGREILAECLRPRAAELDREGHLSIYERYRTPSWWVPIDEKWSCSDMVYAHETGHGTFTLSGAEFSPDVWELVAKQLEDVKKPSDFAPSSTVSERALEILVHEQRDPEIRKLLQSALAAFREGTTSFAASQLRRAANELLGGSGIKGASTMAKVDTYTGFAEALRGAGLVIDRWFADRTTRNELRSQISVYSGTTLHELAAELWAEYTLNEHPRAPAKAYGDWVVHQLEELRKREAERVAAAAA